MDNQKNNKEQILKEIQEQEKQIERIVNDLEKEVKELRKNNLKKELLLQELLKITEQ